MGHLVYWVYSWGYEAEWAIHTRITNPFWSYDSTLNCNHLENIITMIT